MRKARDAKFLMNDAGTLVGINLGADFTAEHEWGLGSLVDDFGIPKELTRKVFGMKRRTATKVHAGLRLVSHGDVTYLVSMADYNWKYIKSGVEGQQLLDRSMEVYDDEELQTAWAGGMGSGEFAIRTTTKEGAAHLKEVFDAAQKCDIALTLGGGGPFQNAGLAVLIPSRISKELLDQMSANDLDHLDLLDASKATGIEEKLRTVGKKWYALSPRWASSLQSTKDGEVKTAHKVVYWLNPQDQQRNNYGWFTVEQLLEWAEDKGPIPMKQKRRA